MGHIVNKDALEWVSWEEGADYAGRCKQLAAAAGAKQLGCRIIQLEPGKRPWPAHYHLGNEEAIYVLKGKGSLRLGKDTFAVKAGDYIALPASPDLAHQLRNDGDEVLEYLCMSTMNPMDVVGYPDSKKIGVIAGAAPGANPEERLVSAFFPEDAKVPYWQGEI